MLDNYLRVGAALSMAVIGLVFVADALTINAGWRTRQRPRGLVWNQRGLVAASLVLLAVALFLAVIAVGVMV